MQLVRRERCSRLTTSETHLAIRWRIISRLTHFWVMKRSSRMIQFLWTTKCTKQSGRQHMKHLKNISIKKAWRFRTKSKRRWALRNLWVAKATVTGPKWSLVWSIHKTLLDRTTTRKITYHIRARRVWTDRIFDTLIDTSLFSMRQLIIIINL